MSSIYKHSSPEELEELFSQFLVSGWSYSAISTFARNEKAFEMQYIYGMYGKKSATTMAGSAYHEALRHFFDQKKQGKEADIVDMEAVAFRFIDDVPANQWKVQKTTPTIEKCREKANEMALSLIRNFMEERAVYEDYISDVIDVEVYFSEFLTINGVDIPLPCSGKIDLVVKTKDGKHAIIDHKSKPSYTPEEELALSCGMQAITYVKGYEEKAGITIDEVCFIENKHSQNRDKSPQLQPYTIEITPDTRKLYEAMLYEPLRRMIEAVNDPDHVYIMNDADNYVDRAELYDFWARTMICEIEDFNVEDTKKEIVAKRLNKIRNASAEIISPKVIKNFKEKASQFIQYDLTTKNMTEEQKIEHVLRSFGISTRVAHKFDGFSSSTFLLEVSAGVKIASVYGYRMDIANALNVPSIRIPDKLLVYEGRSYLPVEFAKRSDKVLSFDPSLIDELKIPVGKDNFNQLVCWDLNNQSTPHALVCGATGSGKSVMLRCTIEYAKKAGISRIIIFDPKFEFTGIKGVEVYNDILEIETMMELLVEEMNERVKKGRKEMTLVIFDEFADAISAARSGNDLKVYEMVQTGVYANGSPKHTNRCVGEHKHLEENMRVLLQKGRSSGFRIIAATQRASVKVITGDAKVNFPVQICFRVPKESDSRVVLDESGAESLAGRGDGLIKSPEYGQTVRFQAFFYDESKEA